MDVQGLQKEHAGSTVPTQSMRAQGITPIELKDYKKNFIRSVIETNFSAKALHSVIRGETSSRCESPNRAVNKGLAKIKSLFSLTLEVAESLQPQE